MKHLELLVNKDITIPVEFCGDDVSRRAETGS